MSNQSELAQLASVFAGSALSNRNLIINGAMQVAQRGTSSTSSGYVSLDRWYVNQSGGSTTFSQETNSNPSETGGIKNYARLNVSTSSDFTSIRQPIEDVASVPSGTITISFWAKGTAPTGGLYIWGTQNFGSGGSADVSITPVQVTPTLTSSWVRYSSQVTISSIDGKTIGTSSYLLINIGQYSNTSTTAFDLNITGVQLEIGDTSTPFEHELYSVTLQKCQRYFCLLSKAYGVVHSANSTISAFSFVEYPVRMRATPTITTDHTVCNFYLGGSTRTISALTPQNIDNQGFQNHLQGSGFITGNAGHLDANGLFYKADAEL